MQNGLGLVLNNDFGSIRTITINEKIWFAGKDVAEILQYSAPDKAIRDHVNDEDKKMFKPADLLNLEFLGGNMCYRHLITNRGLYFINESGLYSLALSSKMPQAVEFKKWVTSEVLPSIKENGYYVNKAQIVQEETKEEPSQSETSQTEVAQDEMSTTALFKAMASTFKNLADLTLKMAENNEKNAAFLNDSMKFIGEKIDEFENANSKPALLPARSDGSTEFVPEIPPGTMTLSQMATELGIYSSNNIPHANAVQGILKALGINEVNRVKAGHEIYICIQSYPTAYGRLVPTILLRKAGQDLVRTYWEKNSHSLMRIIRYKACQDDNSPGAIRNVVYKIKDRRYRLFTATGEYFIAKEAEA